VDDVNIYVENSTSGLVRIFLMIGGSGRVRSHKVMDPCRSLAVLCSGG